MLCGKCKQSIPDEALFCQFCGKQQSKAKTERTVKSRGNGEGSVYKTPTGSWACQVTKYKGGLRKVVVKRGFKTKKEALEYLPQLSLNKAKKRTISVMEAYKAISPKLEKLSTKRFKCYESAYKHLKHIEMCDMDILSLADLQSVIDDIDGGYYSKRYVKDLFSKIYNYAFADGKVERNLAPYIELPENIPQKEKTTFTKSEVDSIWEAWRSGNEFAGYILIIIYCAIRTGELWSIKSKDVDFNKHIMYGGIKTDRGKYAPIYIVPQIEPVVKYFVGKNPFGTLFCGSPKIFYEAWREFKADIKLREELQPYSGRHTCATIATEAGLPEAVIMSIMRHEKYDTTLQYTHVDIESTLLKLEFALNQKL